MKNSLFTEPFSANSPTASPDFGRPSLQQKFLTNLNSPTPFNANSSIIQQQQQSLFQAQNQNSNANNNANASGPPINSLFDNLRSEKSFQTPSKTFFNQQQPPPPHQDNSIILNRSGFNQSRIMSPIPNSNMNDFNNSHAYPNAIQPSFNQSINSGGGVRSHEFWVTVFGFPSTSLDLILSHFSACGTILEKVCSAGNYIHLRFSSRGECDKAMLYNGKIIGNNTMIGVIRCNDESVFEKENDSQLASVNRIRSLTQAAYKSAKYDTEVLHGADDPKKTSSGIVSRAVDLLFGW